MPDSSRTTRTRSKIEHWLLLLISPFVISLIASIVVAVGTNTQVSTRLWVLLIISALIWVGCYLAAFTGAFQALILWWAGFRRRTRFAKPHVVVLDGRISDDGLALVSSLYTTRSPDEWCQELRVQNPSWHINLASVDHALMNETDIIINPFGEVYPEEDLSLHTTFIRIRDYVRAGGIFVNIAGYPFWWKSNPATGVKAEAGRWEQQPPNLMILKPLLPDLLGISPIIPGSPHHTATRQERRDHERFGEIAGAGGGNDAILFRPYPITTQRMIPMLRSDNGQEIVIGAVPYGAGHFLFAGVEIDQNSPSFAKVLAAIRGWAKYESEGRA